MKNRLYFFADPNKVQGQFESAAWGLDVSNENDNTFRCASAHLNANDPSKAYAVSDGFIQIIPQLENNYVHGNSGSLNSEGEFTFTLILKPSIQPINGPKVKYYKNGSGL